MERKQSFQSGRVWLNVFGTEDGQSIVTINKSFIRDGEWKSSPFFNVDRGDVENIKSVLEQYEESTKEVVVQ